MSRKIIQDDKELLQLSQIEFKKLQRQYRIMEGDKNSYASEIKCYLQKQRKIIETLQKEEVNLLSKLSREKTVNARDDSNQWRKDFTELLKTYEKYLVLIKQKRNAVVKLDKKISNLQGETKIHLYYGDTKTTQMDENIEKSKKQIQMLQNKLYNETVKYDKALAENSITRQAVDALLKDRTRFNELYKKLVMKLNSDKKKLLASIEQATVACEQRNEADEKLKSTLNREKQDSIVQKHKMRELHRQLDHLINLKEFLSIKGQKRVLIDLEEKEARKKQEKIEQIETLMKKHYSILEQLKEFCNESNVEKLAEIFSKQEEENFALFNYVNEINNEVESLQNEVDSLQTSLKEQRKLSNASQKTNISSLECFKKDLQLKKNAMEEMRKEFLLNTSVLEIMFGEIGNIFSLLKHSSPSLINLLGENQVSSLNVRLLLDIIQKKVEDFTSTI